MNLSLTLHNLFPRDYFGILNVIHTVVLIYINFVVKTHILERFNSPEINYRRMKLNSD
jgi:hypothetical protein